MSIHILTAKKFNVLSELSIELKWVKELQQIEQLVKVVLKRSATQQQSEARSDCRRHLKHFALIVLHPLPLVNNQHLPLHLQQTLYFSFQRLVTAQQHIE
jgi:hypothetical protein